MAAVRPSHTSESTSMGACGWGTVEAWLAVVSGSADMMKIYSQFAITQTGIEWFTDEGVFRRRGFED